MWSIGRNGRLILDKIAHDALLYMIALTIDVESLLKQVDARNLKTRSGVGRR